MNDPSTLTPTPADLDTLSRQLGRPVRDVVEIGARCICGNPLVATTAPRLSNGIPFPTTFYLTHPVITAAVSRLEAAGIMAEMTDRLKHDENLAVRHQSAHEHYLALRSVIGERTSVGPVPEIDGVSAGGMPTRVKCLHVLVGHSLAAGPGVNPLGDEALERIDQWWDRDHCYCEGAWDSLATAPVHDLSRHTKTQGLSAADLAEKRARRQVAEPVDLRNRVAAIDCGTNSIRLLIADVDDGQLTDVVRLMRVVRLGAGVDATGRLDDEALQRTFAAAEEYAALIAEHGATRTRFVATSATRDASNREDFVVGIRKRLGVNPEVISGNEEADLSFRGAASSLDISDDDRVLVVDIGGGSTEFVAGGKAGSSTACSTDMGCVRYTEKYLTSDPPEHAEINAALAAVREMIDLAARDVAFDDVTRLVGVAGSVTTITAHALRLQSYEPQAIHAAELDAGTVVQACNELLTMPRRERAALPYMHPGRVDVIGSGALIWRTIIEELALKTGGRVAGTTTSEHDILDGIALSVAAVVEH